MIKEYFVILKFGCGSSWAEGIHLIVHGGVYELSLS